MIYNKKNNKIEYNIIEKNKVNQQIIYFNFL